MDPVKKSFCFTTRADLAACVSFIIENIPFSHLETWGDGVPQLTFEVIPGDAANVAFFLNDHGIKYTAIR